MTPRIGPEAKEQTQAIVQDTDRCRKHSLLNLAPATVTWSQNNIFFYRSQGHPMPVVTTAHRYLIFLGLHNHAFLGIDAFLSR